MSEAQPQTAGGSPGKDQEKGKKRMNAGILIPDVAPVINANVAICQSKMDSLRIEGAIAAVAPARIKLLVRISLRREYLSASTPPTILEDIQPTPPIPVIVPTQRGDPVRESVNHP